MIIEPKIEMPAVNNVLSIFVVICQAEMYRSMERLQYLVYQQTPGRTIWLMTVLSH